MHLNKDMRNRNYYEVLGVSTNANSREIKRAFRALARKYHPDTNSDAKSKDIFKEANEAYQTLSKEDKRKRYDEKNGISRKETSNRKSTNVNSTSSNKQNNTGFQKDAPGWRFESARKKAGETYEAPTGQRLNPTAGYLRPVFSKWHKLKNIFIKEKDKFQAKHSSQFKSFVSKKSDDYTSDLNNIREFVFSIDTLESIHGTTREVAFNDSGIPRIFRIKIPSMTDNNAQLKIRAKDNNGQDERMIYARINVTPHPLVERNGLDLIINMPVTIGEALRGTELDVPTLTGPVKVKLPSQINKDMRIKRLRLKGRGLQKEDKSITGDMYVRVYIVAPDRESQTLMGALEAVDVHYSGDVRSQIPKKL
jgi:DnaJ-class molecular chaperone